MIIPVIRLLAVPLRRLFPAGGRLAVDSLLSNPTRTAATAAALMIGLSVVVVNSTMSASFMGTVDDQLEATFARDFTVQAAGQTLETGGGPGVPRGLSQQIAAMPETRAVTPIRVLFLDLPGIETGQKQGIAKAYDPSVYGLMDGTPIKGATREAALRGVARGRRHHRRPVREAGRARSRRSRHPAGPRGSQLAPVTGVLDGIGDYGGNEMQLSLADDARRLRHHERCAAGGARSLGCRRAGRSSAASRTLMSSDYPGLELASLADKKKEVSDQVSATFNMFNSIVAIAVVVSLLGVINTLAMSVLERTRELGVLRALGSSRWQVRNTMLAESLLICAAGAFCGVAAGVAIGAAWIPGFAQVMPGLTFHFPATTALGVALAAIVLGTLAAILPARRAARLKVIEALSYE